MMKILLNIGYFMGLYLMNQHGLHPKVVVCFGASIAVTGMIFSSFTKSFWVFTVAYGAMYGLGGGTCFMLSLQLVSEFYPENKGFYMGLLLGAYGFSPFLFS